MSTTEWQMQFIAAILSRLSNGIVQFQIQTRGFFIADFKNIQNHTDGDNMRQSKWKNMFFCSSVFFLQQKYIENERVYVSRDTRRSARQRNHWYTYNILQERNQ